MAKSSKMQPKQVKPVKAVEKVKEPEQVVEVEQEQEQELIVENGTIAFVLETRKEAIIIDYLKAAKELCTQCAAERRANGLSITRVANVGRMLNEHIKVLTPLLNDH